MNNKQIAAIGLDADFAGIFKHMDETSAWILCWSIYGWWRKTKPSKRSKPKLYAAFERAEAAYVAAFNQPLCPF
jgi:hypothetical protein